MNVNVIVFDGQSGALHSSVHVSASSETSTPPQSHLWATNAASFFFALQVNAKRVGARGDQSEVPLKRFKMPHKGLLAR